MVYSKEEALAELRKGSEQLAQLHDLVYKMQLDCSPDDFDNVSYIGINTIYKQLKVLRFDWDSAISGIEKIKPKLFCQHQSIDEFGSCCTINKDSTGVVRCPYFKNMAEKKCKDYVARKQVKIG